MSPTDYLGCLNLQIFLIRFVSFIGHILIIIIIIICHVLSIQNFGLGHNTSAAVITSGRQTPSSEHTKFRTQLSTYLLNVKIFLWVSYVWMVE